jgi:hypothetical protein
LNRGIDRSPAPSTLVFFAVFERGAGRSGSQTAETGTPGSVFPGKGTGCGRLSRE